MGGGWTYWGEGWGVATAQVRTQRFGWAESFLLKGRPFQTSLCERRRCSIARWIRGDAPREIVIMGLKRALFLHSSPNFLRRKISYTQTVDLQPSGGGGSPDPSQPPPLPRAWVPGLPLKRLQWQILTIHHCFKALRQPDKTALYVRSLLHSTGENALLSHLVSRKRQWNPSSSWFRWNEFT